MWHFRSGSVWWSVLWSFKGRLGYVSTPLCHCLLTTPATSSLSTDPVLGWRHPFLIRPFRPSFRDREEVTSSSEFPVDQVVDGPLVLRGGVGRRSRHPCVPFHWGHSVWERRRGGLMSVSDTERRSGLFTVSTNLSGKTLRQCNLSWGKIVWSYSLRERPTPSVSLRGVGWSLQIRD